jgi:phosphoglycerate dehydrogenase-like enzyme
MTMAGKKRLHLHIENAASKDPVFHITEKVYRAACKRHADVAQHVRATWTWDGVGFAQKIATADVLIASLPPIGLIRAHARNLKVVHVTAAGIERWLPLENWLPGGVKFVRNSGPHVGKAIEFVTMSLLMLNTGMPEVVTNQRHAAWRQIFTSRIAGKTALIIGLGHMGGAAAAAARRLGLKTIGVRRSGKPTKVVDEVHTPRRIDSVLPKADFVVITAPLTPETRGLLNRERIAKLKRGAGLINIGRAAIVDYDAMCEALKAGRLGGAILDVYHEEPLPEASPLWRTPNLIVNPHCSSDDADGYIPGSLDLLFDNLRRLLAGKPLKNVVTDAKGY